MSIQKIRLKDYSEVSKGVFVLDDKTEEELKNYNEEDKDYKKTQITNICKEVEKQIKSNGNKNVETLFEKNNKNNNKNNEKISVFTTYNNEYRTSKYVGVIKAKIDEDIITLSTKIKDTQNQHNNIQNKVKNLKDVTLTISSRFDNEDNQKFLNYVFLKAFDSSGKIFKDMNPMSSPEKTWDMLLMYVYIDQLEDAFTQGVFRKYDTFEYNDSKVKGRIDISRHIKLNPMNNGKIAYSTREYTVDNSINHLILLTYETLKRKYGYNFVTLVNSNKIIKDGIQNLKNSIPNYKSKDKIDTIHKSSKKINHSLYTNYEPLRKTSISILRRLGLNIYKNTSDEVCGVLIPIDKLWEKFLYNTIFSKIQYKDNRIEEQSELKILRKVDTETSTDESKEKRILKPDFYLKNKFVFDAKYRDAWGKNTIYKDTWDSNVREDIFQVLAYMLSFNVNIGGTIFPLEIESKSEKEDVELEVDCYKVSKYCNKHKFYTIGYKIPTYIEDITEFNEYMDNQNEGIKEFIENIIKSSDL